MAFDVLIKCKFYGIKIYTIEIRVQIKKMYHSNFHNKIICFDIFNQLEYITSKAFVTHWVHPFTREPLKNVPSKSELEIYSLLFSLFFFFFFCFCPPPSSFFFMTPTNVLLCHPHCVWTPRRRWHCHLTWRFGGDLPSHFSSHC